jgi:hypothetical protein
VNGPGGTADTYEVAFFARFANVQLRHNEQCSKSGTGTERENFDKGAAVTDARTAVFVPVEVTGKIKTTSALFFASLARVAAAWMELGFFDFIGDLLFRFSGLKLAQLPANILNVKPHPDLLFGRHHGNVLLVIVQFHPKQLGIQCVVAPASFALTH